MFSKTSVASLLHEVLSIFFVIFELFIIWREALYVGWSQEGRHGTCPANTKLSITHSFLELQSPDCAWKFIWTVQKNSKNKMAAKY